KILEAVRTAYECGFRTMIVESHPRMKEFMKLYEKDGTFKMNFILQLPFVSGYVRHMAEGGVRGVAREVLAGTPRWELVKAPFALLSPLARKDYYAIGVKGLDLEMSKYSDFDISGVLLHNIITDVLMSLDAETAFAGYFDRVQRRFGVKAGLITLNLPLLSSHLNQWGLEPSVIMSPMNPYGFDMNPSQEVVEEYVRGKKVRTLAMNVLGGGSVPLSEAATYIKGLGGVEGVVIGASSRKHMEELTSAFRE
ncbi:MAG TPA: hypothetical protein PLJ11_09105, partial [Methanomassiliicoccales archaeon]|nr:hypothetical protein [Methanomassiliicoccales archaeon]